MPWYLLPVSIWHWCATHHSVQACRTPGIAPPRLGKRGSHVPLSFKLFCHLLLPQRFSDSCRLILLELMQSSPPLRSHLWLSQAQVMDPFSLDSLIALTSHVMTFYLCNKSRERGCHSSCKNFLWEKIWVLGAKFHTKRSKNQFRNAFSKSKRDC